MTPETMDRIDAEVARHVIGFGDRVHKLTGPNGRWVIGGAFPVAVRQYTRDHAAMMDVIEAMRKRKRRVLTVTYGDRTICEINVPGDEREYTACDASMPLAVALASLKAHGVEVPQ